MTKTSKWMLRLIVLVATVAPARAAENAAPPFAEIYSLLRSNLAGVSEEALNQAAVEGLLLRLGPVVALDAATNRPAGPSLAAATNFDGAFGYLRASTVDRDLRRQMDDAWVKLVTNVRPKGLVLDLRFANGTDYAAAVQAADKFISAERPVLDWGGGLVRTTAKDEAWKLPIAVLINEQTSGGAEALAGILRSTDTALLIGTNTAGKAAITRDFFLRNGHTLRIATAPIKLGNGETLSNRGVRADIVVDVRPELEREFLADPYRATGRVGPPPVTAVAPGATNRPPRKRLTEADLVRMQREGEESEADLTTSGTLPSPERPVLADPALVRALDLLKGLAVVQQLR